MSSKKDIPDKNINKPKMPSEDVDKNKETIKKPKMMKNGLTDRPFLSWIRILLVAAIWWSLVAGFFCICFFLMNQILYGSEDDQPYFARTFMKYPGILNQPSLNIKCLKPDNVQVKKGCDTTKLSIGINKIFNFEPKSFAKDEVPEGLRDKLNKLGVTGELADNVVHVTCEGLKDEDKENLEGMKINSGESGFPFDKFPWTKNKENWPKVSLDLSSSKVVKGKVKQKVMLECRAWAKNIEREERFVDKKTPRGGALVALCFDDNGKIVKAEDCE